LLVALGLIVVLCLNSPRNMGWVDNGYSTKEEAIESVGDYLDIKQKFEQGGFVYIKGVVTNSGLDKGNKIIEFDGEKWKILSDINAQSRIDGYTHEMGDYIIESIAVESEGVRLIIISPLLKDHIQRLSDSTGVPFESCENGIKTNKTVYYKFIESETDDYQLFIEGNAVDFAWLKKKNAESFGASQILMLLMIGFIVVVFIIVKKRKR